MTLVYDCPGTITRLESKYLLVPENMVDSSEYSVLLTPYVHTTVFHNSHDPVDV